MQKLKAKMTKFKRNKRLKRNNPLLYNVKKTYIKEYGEADIQSYTDLEDNLYRNILLVESEQELHNLELQTKTQIECRARSNIIAGGSLCLSVIALFATFFTNIANANGKMNELAIFILGFIFFALILANMVVQGHSYDRHAIPYYKLQLQCIEKVKKEQKKSKRKGKSKYKAKKKEVEM